MEGTSLLLRVGKLVTSCGSVLQKTLLLFHVSSSTKKYKRANFVCFVYFVCFVFSKNILTFPYIPVNYSPIFVTLKLVV
jgi:hypothetical protein